MGLFSALFGASKNRNVKILPDVVWLTKKAKSAGIRKDVAERAAGDAIAILLISHFDEAHQEMTTIAENCKGTVPVMPVLAEQLSSQIASQFDAGESSCIELIVGERHPLTTEDDRVLANFANDLKCQCRVTYHISLDDSLMQLFVGDFVRQILEKLGMKEDEAIESAMIQKRIRQAQKKITESATGNRPAESQEKWMDLNLPSGSK